MAPDQGSLFSTEDRRRVRHRLLGVIGALMGVVTALWALEWFVVRHGLVQSPSQLQALDRDADGRPLATWPVEARRDMPYLEWREHLVRADWRPVASDRCASAPRWRDLCRALPELSDCVVGSHCSARFIGPDGRTALDVRVQSPPDSLDRSLDLEVALARFEVFGWSRQYADAPASL